MSSAPIGARRHVEETREDSVRDRVERERSSPFSRDRAYTGDFPAVVRDDGTGLGNGLKLEHARRRAAHQGVIEDGLDVSHTSREAGRAPRTTWGAATRAGTCRHSATGVGSTRPSGPIAHRP